MPNVQLNVNERLPKVTVTYSNPYYGFYSNVNTDQY